MSIKQKFQEFNKAIKLNDSKKQTLTKNRSALREKIREHCKEHEWESPRFYSQGSFVTNTIINPIKEKQSDGSTKEKYDIDDGVYFIGGERQSVDTYHYRIKEAVKNHAKDCIDKNTCVRVVYADGHHIDLPIYWLENEDDIPQLAHKKNGFEDSDPKEFKKWLDDRISQTNQKGQLRRIIRYVKAWADYRMAKNNSLKMPSGIVWTVLCAQYLVEDDSDEKALTQTMSQILNNLISCYMCFYPTTPVGKDLLQKYNKDTVLKELRLFVDDAEKALVSNLVDAVNLWRKIFGDRFPCISNASLPKASVVATGIVPEVARPYGDPQ